MPSESNGVIVRVATVEDVNLLHRFSVDLAHYEDEPDAVTSTPQTLARDGFGKNPQFAALIAELGGKPVGFALYTFNYSVWTAARGIFIEDDPAALVILDEGGSELADGHRRQPLGLRGL